MYLEIQNHSNTISKIPILRTITIGMERGKMYGLRG